MNLDEVLYTEFIRQVVPGDFLIILPRSEAELVKGLGYMPIPDSKNVTVLATDNNIKLLEDAGYKTVSGYRITGEGGNK
ncbi:hypothetical protein ES707_07414 [subsurface metagenome]